MNRRICFYVKTHDASDIIPT
uniref:Uncharacterized protein n=1 Tax=Rhizophora mucronata TaxID=61149 RepID=A0A2P2QN23_RHIMU